MKQTNPGKSDIEKVGRWVFLKLKALALVVRVLGNTERLKK